VSESAPMRLVALESERVARMSGAPFDSIRCQLGANRAAISGGHTRISPAGVPAAALLAHAGYANLTGNCWVAGEDGCPARPNGCLRASK
jgi:hypothetical protein